MKRILAGTLLGLTSVVVIALGAIYTGVFNVAAFTQETGLARWIMRTGMEQSVRVGQPGTGLALARLGERGVVRVLHLRCLRGEPHIESRRAARRH